jgi:hypothetical protein
VNASYKASPIKRHRRTKVEIESLKAGIYDIVAEQHPVNVRQVYYQAVVRGLIAKTEAEYGNAISRLMLEMRRDGVLPYPWVVDNTRWVRRPRTYRGLADFIETHQTAYRRSVWAGRSDYCEVWCEKEALAGVIVDVTSEYDVPLMVSRGFASESYLYSAADAITDELSEAGTAQRAHIYYFGDYDPSGLKISESIERGLRKLCRSLIQGFDDDMLVFERVVVNEDTIAAHDLPSRPTKTKGNSHARDWPDGRESVELDAMPAPELRRLVRACIEQHIGDQELDVLREVERQERDQLRIFGRQIEGAAP